MQAYDILMVIVLALAILWGAWKGLAWQIASIASIGLSYFVALRFRLPLAGVITASPPWNIFLAMLILFLGTGLIVWVGFNLVSEFIERVKLKEFDRQLGALFGAAKGVLLCVLVTLFSVALLGDAQRQAICNSRSGYYIAVFLDRADMMIPRELHDVLAPYLDKLDRTIPHPHAARNSLSPATAWGDAQNGQVGPNQQRPVNWQQELEAVFGGQGQNPGPALQPSFPTDEEATHTAGRIEAQPARPAADGSFRRW
jgi:membrane protein required for colicin V production